MPIRMTDDELLAEKMYGVKEFADRNPQRESFWKRYNEMAQEGSVIICFFGTGGVGKSALLKKLEEEVEQYNEKLQCLNGKRNSYCVKYDFSIGTDMRDVLKAFKSRLSNNGCNFPLFDVGNYYYSLTMGQDAKAPRQPTHFEQLPFVQTLKQKLSVASSTAGNAMTMFSATQKIFDAAKVGADHWLDSFLSETLKGLGNAMPFMRTATLLMSVADMFLEEYMQRKGLIDKQHQFIRNQLNDRRQKKDPAALYEYLPKLFARDVADWMAQTGNKLVVFLDNYESLVGTTNFISAEQRKRDLWLRGYEGLMCNIPNTLWTIAGRNKLRWDGNLAEELEQHKIIELTAEDSKIFLKKAGIADEKLLNGLVELTKGYPIFLDLCVDVYVEYKRQNPNGEPQLKEFGQKQLEVVDRILRYIDVNLLVAKDMLKYLCVLNVWTDEIAIDIGNSVINGKVVINFSRAVYELVKNVSFIQPKCIENEDENLTLEFFRFDNTIQSLILSTCNKKLINDLKPAVNNYFKEFFADKKSFNVKNIFYLKLWAEFIARFADDAAKLLQQYKEMFANHVLTLTNNARFDAVENILMLFMNKLETLGGTKTLTYTYFEMDFGRLKRAQGHYKAAYEIIKSAYKKRVRLLKNDAPETIETLHLSAILLNDLGQYDRAIKFHKQVLKLRIAALGKEDAATIESMHGLAVSLNNRGRYDEALKLRKKVLALRKKVCGKKHPDTLKAMHNLAISLSSLGRYDEALVLQKKVLAVHKKTLGNKHLDTIDAMNNLALTLGSLKRYDAAAQLQEKVLALYKNVLGDEHPETIDAMNNLALTLSSLERYDEAAQLQEKVLALYQNILGGEHPHTLIAMHNLAILLSTVGRDKEAFELREKALRSSKNIFSDEKNPDTIAVMNDMAISLGILERYEEALPLQEKVLAFYKNTLPEDHPNTIAATDNLAITLTFLKRYEEALPLQEKVLNLHKKIYGEDDPATLDDADAVANILNKIGRRAEAIALQRDTLAKCEKIFDDFNPLKINIKKNLVEMLLNSGEREEARQLVEQLVPTTQKTFGVDHPKSKDIIGLRKKILNVKG